MKILDWFRRADARAIVVLAAFPFIYFWQVTLGQQVWHGTDILRLFHPLGVELGRALNEGRLPLWTPYLQAGFPLLAEGQIAALYPPNWIVFRFLPAHHALSYGMLIHLTWAGVGMYACARTFRLAPASAFLAGFVFSFNAFQFSHLIHPPIVAAASWLPWLIFLQARFLRARQEEPRHAPLYSMLLTFALALQFTTGSIQIAFLNTLAFLVIAIFSQWLWKRAPTSKLHSSSFSNSRFLKQFFIGIALPLLLAAGIAAIQLLPTAELVGLSVRNNLREDFAASYALPVDWLAQFVLPFAQGEPSESNNEYWGYFGIAAFLLAFAAPFLRRDRRTIFFTLFALGALLFALGDSIPINTLLYRLPPFNFFRVPARYLLLVVFAGALLAATALDELTRQFAGKANRTARGIVILFVGVIIIELSASASPFMQSLAWLNTPANVLAPVRSLPQLNTEPAQARVWTDESYFPSIPGLRNSLFPNFALVPGKSSAQIFSSLALARNETYVNNLSPAMLNVLDARYITIPLESRPKGVPLTPPENLFANVVRNPVMIVPTPVKAIELTAFSDQALELADGFVAGELETRFADGSGQTFPLRLGVEIADWDYERASAENKIERRRAIVARSFPAFSRSFGRAFDGHTYLARFEFSAVREIVSVSVRANLSPARLIVESVALIDGQDRGWSLATLARKNNFRVAYWSDTVAVWENQDALPRAFIAHQAELINDGAAITRMQQSEWDPAREVFLSEGRAMSMERAAHDSTQITRYENERVQIAVNTDRTGYLVLADSWYPGWVARVDGRDAPIVRADLIFRAVAVEAGGHTVEFVYEPLSFKIGAMISMASSLTTIGIAIFIRRTNRGNEQ